MMKRLAVAGALALALASPAPAQTYRDSAGTIVPGVANAGSTGRDSSANPPALPNVGAGFGATGPYANYVLIATAPANASRLSIDVENTSGAQIAIALDDGTAASGTAPVNATVFALAGGSASGAQGGSWVSLVEKGRVQIFAPSSAATVARP
jgi:hypothetical protein